MIKVNYNNLTIALTLFAVCGCSEPQKYSDIKSEWEDVKKAHNEYGESLDRKIDAIKKSINELDQIYKATDGKNRNQNAFNDVVWRSDAVTVSKYSVIPVPAQCPEKARIDLTDKFKTNTIKLDAGEVFLVVQFSANKSPDSKYWVIDSTVECDGYGSNCITSKVLDYKSKTKAVVSCMKYKGMTIRFSKDGEPVIESYIPEHQKAIKQVKFISDDNERVLTD